jgi:hypothetical protein
MKIKWKKFSANKSKELDEIIEKENEKSLLKKTICIL